MKKYSGKTAKGIERIQYWAQQPITWIFLLGGGVLGWQLAETLALQNRVNKNTNVLRTIEELGQASDINVERRLQTLQSKTSAIDENQDSLTALHQVDQELDNRLTATQQAFGQLEELTAADQQLSNRIQNVESELAQANEKLVKAKALETKLESALKRLGEAENRFDQVQEVYQSLSDAQKYILELEQSRQALAAIEAKSQDIVYKQQLATTKDELLRTIQNLVAKEEAARQAMQVIPPQVPLVTPDTKERLKWVLPAVIVGVVGVSVLMVWWNWNNPVRDSLPLIRRASSPFA